MFSKRIILCCAVICGVSLGCQNLVYADEVTGVTELAKSFIDLNNAAIEHDGLHIIEDNGILYNADYTGNIIVGWSYDNLGNLYYSDETGKLFRNERNEDGLYFNNNGQLHSQSMDNLENYKEMAKRFENGDKVKFGREEDLLDFFEYYSLNYKLGNYDCAYTVYKDAEGKSYAFLDKNETYDREKLRHKIVEKFGNVDSEISNYDKILEVSRKIATNMEYDLNYKDTGLSKALDDSRGVCWHYAKIAKVLLDEAGIYNEVMIGFANNEEHMWLRCLVDERWVYTDPTMAKTMWWSYSNLAYSTFTSSYRPIRNVIFTPR